MKDLVSALHNIIVQLDEANQEHPEFLSKIENTSGLDVLLALTWIHDELDSSCSLENFRVKYKVPTITCFATGDTICGGRHTGTDHHGFDNS